MPFYPEDQLKKHTYFCGEMNGPRTPRWVKEMVLYEVYVRNFSTEGNFIGLISQLDRLKDLGITAIWLMPIHPIGRVGKKGSQGCPYAIRDYMDINHEYGTMDDFRNLVDEVHKRGMKIILDMVANHSANDNVNITEHPDWFMLDAEGNPTRRNPEWSDVVDNNLNCRELREYLKSVMLFWVKKFDIDGYRCDVAGMVPLDFWRDSVAELHRIKSNLFMLAEWESPHLCTDVFHSDYNSELYQHFEKIKAGKALAQDLVSIVVANRRFYPRNYLPLNYIENHDQKRAAEIMGIEGTKPAAAFIFTIPGIPLIYNGQEIGETRYLSLFDWEPMDWDIALNACRGKKAQELQQYYRTLIKLRKDNPVLTDGEIVPVVNDNPDKVASYMMVSEKDILLVVLNFSQKALTVRVKIPRYMNFIPKRVKFSNIMPHEIIKMSDENTMFSVLRAHGVLVVGR